MWPGQQNTGIVEETIFRKRSRQKNCPITPRLMSSHLHSSHGRRHRHQVPAVVGQALYLPYDRCPTLKTRRRGETENLTWRQQEIDAEYEEIFCTALSEGTRQSGQPGQPRSRVKNRAKPSFGVQGGGFENTPNPARLATPQPNHLGVGGKGHLAMFWL